MSFGSLLKINRSILYTYYELARLCDLTVFERVVCRLHVRWNRNGMLCCSPARKHNSITR
jgi:hypothetical protein